MRSEDVHDLARKPTFFGYLRHLDNKKILTKKMYLFYALWRFVRIPPSKKIESSCFFSWLKVELVNREYQSVPDWACYLQATRNTCCPRRSSWSNRRLDSERICLWVVFLDRLDSAWFTDNREVLSGCGFEMMIRGDIYYIGHFLKIIYRHIILLMFGICQRYCADTKSWHWTIHWKEVKANAWTCESFSYLMLFSSRAYYLV